MPQIHLHLAWLPRLLLLRSVSLQPIQRPPLFELDLEPAIMRREMPFACALALPRPALCQSPNLPQISNTCPWHF